ncbi:MAG TPA: hypothetical protein VIL97_03640 [Thermoanaerobaculia bacterium]
MMSCEGFREACRDGVDTAETREHLRSCPSCLDTAVTIDPDHLFRALGGDPMIPPGGVDAFVADVMQQVQVRKTERRLGSVRRFPTIYRWGVAASLTVGLLSIALLDKPASSPMAAPNLASRPAVVQQELVVRPVVEEYQMASATIVEVPTEPADDLKVVMIFDESLPVDL